MIVIDAINDPSEVNNNLCDIENSTKSSPIDSIHVKILKGNHDILGLKISIDFDQSVAS